MQSNDLLWIPCFQLGVCSLFELLKIILDQNGFSNFSGYLFVL